jgi:biotin carboxyl carrier protein
MSNTLDHHSLFLMPVWKAVGKSKVIVQGRNLPKTVIISSIIALALLIMLIVPVDFTLSSKGALQPVDKQEVYAPLGGEIWDVRADEGQAVEKGETLIVMRNDELESQIAELTGKVATSQGRLQSITYQVLHPGKLTPGELANLQIQKAELAQELDTQHAELKIKVEQYRKLTITAPRSGRIITWDAKENLLGRPVEMGQSLMVVANENSLWELELFVPERRAGKLRKAFIKAQGNNEKVPVRFILMTDPGTSRTGTVREVENSTFVHEDEGPCVRVKVDLDEPIDNPRPNSSLTAKVVVGRCNLFYYWFHEAWEYVEGNFLFF